MNPSSSSAPGSSLRRRFRDALERVHAAMAPAGEGATQGETAAEPIAPAKGTQGAGQPADELEARLTLQLQSLEVALKAAQEGSEAKTRFLDRLGHEIRTPMSGLLGLCQLLAGTPLDETQRNYLGLLQRTADQLLELLTELLDFSRLEAGQLALEPQAVNLRELLDASVAAFHSQAAERRLLLEADLAPGLPPVVSADPARLAQVCRHLLDNALKFTTVGQVLLTAFRQGDEIVIEVADTGQGMEPALQSRAFLPFVQGDDSLARRHGGLGLGLTVVETLVRAMGGEVGLLSEPGRGSRFRLQLPLPLLELADPPLAAEPRHRVALVSDAPASRDALANRLEHLNQEVVARLSWRELAFEPEALAALAPQAVVYDQPPEGWPAGQGPESVGEDGLAWKAIWLHRREPSAAAGPASGEAWVHLGRPLTDAALAQALALARGRADDTPAGESASAPPGRVLLVEDDEVNQLVARGFLQQLGYEADVAADAMAALEALQRRDYSLVLMDCQLPGIDGFELTRRIRAGEAGARAQAARVIALTAHASASDREDCLAAGMDDYLSKPVDPAQLGRTLQRWLSTQR